MKNEGVRELKFPRGEWQRNATKVTNNTHVTTRSPSELDLQHLVNNYKYSYLESLNGLATT